jgi:hypothetical protein
LTWLLLGRRHKKLLVLKQVIPIPIEEIQFAGGNGHKILDIKTNIIYMKKLKLILSISLIALFFGCSEENNDVDLDGIDAPSNANHHYTR